ncbi:MAG: hypothetical protein GTN94_15200 [Candidatus Aminicenantes bacterium]|nr:hypothetical protein [Candidatus Aminicenantes bacterium]
MGRLKIENSKTCFSILREFIEDSSIKGSEKERAILALEQLQKITAGTGSGDGSDPVDGDNIGTVGSESDSPGCLGRPRAW